MPALQDVWYVVLVGFLAICNKMLIACRWPLRCIDDTSLALLPPRVRLHVNQGWSYPGMYRVVSEIKCLRSNVNLYSLALEYEYRLADECLEITQPLKQVLLTCPNLRSLTLNIHLPPQEGSTAVRYPMDYCGLGFINGERPPALEALHVIQYPFGVKWASTTPADVPPEMPPAGSLGYPGQVDELDYWADVFDWSRLKSLRFPDPNLASQIMPKLTALEHVDIHNGDSSEDEPQFYLNVPTTLKSIVVGNLSGIDWRSLLHHSQQLRRLEIQRIALDDPDSVAQTLLAEMALITIRQGCPLIEEVIIRVAHPYGELHWRYNTWEILAKFSRLHCLTVWLEENGTGLETPVTYDSAKALFQHLRVHSATQPPRLEELRIYSHAPPKGFSNLFFQQRTIGNRKINCLFVCKLSVRDDEAPHGIFTTERFDLR